MNNTQDQYIDDEFIEDITDYFYMTYDEQEELMKEFEEFLRRKNKEESC